MSLALLFGYLMLNMFRMLIHPSSGAFDLFVELLNGLYCSGSVCWRYVVVWLWCLSPYPDTTPPQPNHNVTPTHIEPDKYRVTQKTGTFEMRSGSHVQLVALRNRDLELQPRHFSNHGSDLKRQ